MICGVDINEVDGNIDWRKMKENGIEFAMLCAGYGSGSIDLQFRKNAETCGRLGIPYGAYWISYAYTLEMAEQEADFCIETIEEFNLSLPLCVKYEDSSVRYAESKGVRVTKEFAKELGKVFCSRTEKAGYISVCYVK